MQVQCIDNDEAFLSLRHEWNALWRDSANPSYFSSHDWIRCCWQELRATRAMRILVVRHGSEPVVIAPWMRSRGSRNKLRVNLMTFIEHPESQVADLLCRATPESEQGFRALMRHLSRELSAEWDLLALDKIPKTSPIVHWFERTQLHSNRSPQKSSSQVLVIPLGGSWDTYLSARSARFRKTLRNITNRIQRMGRVAVKCHRGDQLTAEAIGKLFSIADASWKLESGVAITSSKARKDFFEEVFRSGFTAEGIRIWILEVDGRAIASETQVVDGRTVYALRSDYDEQFGDGSPGVYLQMEILKNLFGGSYQEYNFGAGLNPYKARWTDQHAELMNFRLYNETLYGRLLQWIDQYKTSPFPRLRMLQGVFADKGS